jgi:probable rRNA maturation factor
MIHFFSEDTDFKLPHPIKTRRWIKGVIVGEGFELNQLNYIFCSDEYLLNVNREYLDHDYYTDIITFDNSEEDEIIEGDLFISIDRIKNNAEQMNLPFEEELRRVMIHGVLHLTGYDDTTDELKKKIRLKEDECLKLFK